jgi:hypothetical protein
MASHVHTLPRARPAEASSGTAQRPHARRPWLQALCTVRARQRQGRRTAVEQQPWRQRRSSSGSSSAAATVVQQQQLELGARPRRAASARTRGRGRGSASEGALVLRKDAREGRGAWQGCGRAASLHGHHGDNPSNTWRASGWPKWDTVLGSFRANFGHEPKSKVGAHITLYKFY